MSAEKESMGDAIDDGQRRMPDLKIVPPPSPERFISAPESVVVDGVPSPARDRTKKPKSVSERRRRNLLILIAVVLVVLGVVFAVNPIVSSSSASSSTGSSSGGTVANDHQADFIAASGTLSAPVLMALVQQTIPGSSPTIVTQAPSSVTMQFPMGGPALSAVFGNLTAWLAQPGSSLAAQGVSRLQLRSAPTQQVACAPPSSTLYTDCGTVRPIQGCPSPGMTGANCDQCLPGYYGSNCAQCQQCTRALFQCDDGRDGTGQCTKCLTGWAGSDCQSCAPNYWGPQCSPCSCGATQTCNAGRTGTGACQ
ncbi:Laminin EGF-like domain-containing protein [Plasmodiophora brassicae]